MYFEVWTGYFFAIRVLTVWVSIMLLTKLEVISSGPQHHIGFLRFSFCYCFSQTTKLVFSGLPAFRNFLVFCMDPDLASTLNPDFFLQKLLNVKQIQMPWIWIRILNFCPICNLDPDHGLGTYSNFGRQK